MSSEKNIHVSLGAIVSSQAQAVRVSEMFARVAAGLAFDDDEIYVSLSISTSEISIIEGD